MITGINDSEENVAVAFSKQSQLFDETYSGNTIVQYKRERVRAHVLQYLKPGFSILELNSGTGEDAIWFAARGFAVHATDLSAGMQQVLRRKVETKQLQQFVSQEQCSFTSLNNLSK